MNDFEDRIKSFLNAHNQPTDILRLTADASTREYFRIDWNGSYAIACVYPESFDPAEQTYLDVTKLFLAGDLPVADIIAFAGELGVIIQEDLGDRILMDSLRSADDETRGRLLDEAVSLIAKIQAATGKAFETDSIASRLKFDTEKLLWELNYFKTHYFVTYLKRPLSDADDAGITAEFLEISSELESCAAVLCHRDFHAANLMIDPQGKMRIIDHQDARIGSPAYDLVSLLLDRNTEVPRSDWLADKQNYLLEQRCEFGLDALDGPGFANEFQLQTIQRCLKAVGTFSFQSVERGKTYFVPFIKPMFTNVLWAIEKMDRFPLLREILLERVDEKDPE